MNFPVYVNFFRHGALWALLTLFSSTAFSEMLHVDANDCRLLENSQHSSAFLENKLTQIEDEYDSILFEGNWSEVDEKQLPCEHFRYDGSDYNVGDDLVELAKEIDELKISFEKEENLKQIIQYYVSLEDLRNDSVRLSESERVFLQKEVISLKYLFIIHKIKLELLLDLYEVEQETQNFIVREQIDEANEGKLISKGYEGKIIGTAEVVSENYTPLTSVQNNSASFKKKQELFKLSHQFKKSAFTSIVDGFKTLGAQKLLNSEETHNLVVDSLDIATDLVSGVGRVKSFYAILSGKNLITNEELADSEKIFEFLGIIVGSSLLVKKFSESFSKRFPELKSNYLSHSEMILNAAQKLGIKTKYRLRAFTSDLLSGNNTLEIVNVGPAIKTLGKSGFILVGKGSSLRKISLLPATNPRWGLTEKHLRKHFYGKSKLSLNNIDRAGNADKWKNHLAELFNSPVGSITSNGMLDVVKQFPKADGPGHFKMGIRLKETSDGVFELVTILTKQ